MVDRVEARLVQSSRPQILVVDDDDDLRETVAELLAETGYAVYQASNGAIALERLRDHDSVRPFVILLDLMMPEMNGWEFREAQLRDPDLARIPVVLMTASRDVKGLQTDEILRKPVGLKRLLEAISRFAPDG